MTRSRNTGGGEKKKRKKENLNQTKNNWDKQQIPDIRSEISKMCSSKICGSDRVIILYLTDKLEVKKVSFGVHAWQSGLIYVFFF